MWLEKFAIAIDLLALFATCIPVFWLAIEESMGVESQWRGGVNEFSTKRISYFKTFLKEGGEIWVSTNPDSYQNAAVIRQGEEEHARTHKEGCVISVLPTGGGDIHGSGQSPESR